MPSDTPIAIIGSAYRAPGIGRKGLWEFLCEARSAWSKVPSQRFQQGAFYHPNSEKPGFFSSAGAHFLPDDVFAFDPAFFSITADEASSMDPQHRLLLECAFEAAESAGLSLGDISNDYVGVFAANSQSDYGFAAAEDLRTSNKFVGTGVVPNMFANRLSYYFNLKGPSITVDAACASGSYALHLACQSIRAGECNTAIIGGSTLIITPTTWTMLDTLGALSPAGKCYSYDIKASGFGRGEGAGCMIIKRLDEALANGDPIRAVIRNTATNHSGKTDGISMPSRTAQEDLLYRVHEEIGVLPADTLVIEGHGTGTVVGDPIEASAVASALGKNRSSDNPVYLGSLKSNFGHLEGASGVLATIKAMMMVERGYILPNALFEEINPAITERQKLKVANETIPWPSDGRPRRVCVSNFGFGGSNAIALLEEPPTAANAPDQHELHRSPQINGAMHVNGYGTLAPLNGVNGEVHSKANGVSAHLTNGVNGHANNDEECRVTSRIYAFSARSDVSLTNYLTTFADWLNGAVIPPDFSSDLAYTLGCRRSHFPFRFAAVASSIPKLKEQIKSFSKSSRSREPVIAFVFTGQGAQYAKMATKLRQYKIFNEAIQQAEKQLHALGSTWSLTEELDRNDSVSRINDAEISQPACTAIQLALVKQLDHWGVKPSVVTGHSSGEIASAYAAGMLSFESAIAVAYYRGLAAVEVISDPSIRGSMLALGISAERAETLIEQHQTSGYVTVAAFNSPDSVTLSGDETAIQNIYAAAEAQGIFARKLKINVAYHSRHMEKVASSYIAAIKPWFKYETPGSKSKVKFVSSVTGRYEPAEALGPSYWVANLLNPVRFVDAIETLLSSDEKLPNVIVEVGPHAALKNPIKQILEHVRQQHDKGQKSQSTAYLATLVRGEDADEALLAATSTLYEMGVNLNFSEINQTNISDSKVLTNLPAYEWNKAARYVHQSRIVQKKMHPGHDYHPLLGWKSPYSEGADHSFRQIFTLDDMPWIRGHVIGGSIMFPLTGYICMAVAAFKVLYPSPCSIVIREFNAKSALTVEEGQSVELVTKLTPTWTGSESFASSSWSFEIVSWSEERGWTVHCYGIIHPDINQELISQSPLLLSKLALVEDPSLREQDPEREYTILADNGMRYERLFKTMAMLSLAPGLAVHETLAQKPEAAYFDTTTIDPPTMDAFLHAVGIVQTLGGQDGVRTTWVPVSFSRLRLSGQTFFGDNEKFTTVTELIGRDEKAGTACTRLSIFRRYAKGRMQPVIEWDSIVSKTISRHESARSTPGSIPNSYYLDQVPHMEFWNADEVCQKIDVEPIEQDDLENTRQLEQAALYFMSRAIPNVSSVDEEKLPSYLRKCINWTKRLINANNTSIIDEKAATALIQNVSRASAQGEMLCALGERLTSIFREEVQPLEIMLKDNLLSRNYEQDKRMYRLNRVLGNYVRYIADANPFLRVLEIGAGTGSSTMAIFEALSKHIGAEGCSHIEYTYTDISSGFFERAREKFTAWSRQMTFQKLDVSRNPVGEQGFTAESFDLIIAGNVLHATPNMVQTLTNVKTLLKPGGRLVVVEATKELAAQLPYALLSGWWLAEDEYRGPNGPLLTEEAWDRAFKDTGFSGIEHMVQGYDNSIGLISTTRLDEAQPGGQTRSVAIWSKFGDDESSQFARSLADSLQKGGQDCHVQDIEGANGTASVDSRWSIVIDNSQHSILEDVTAAKFESLHHLLSNAPGILWVIPREHAPETAVIKGMLRTLRQEDPHRDFMLFESVTLDSRGIEAISQLVRRLGAAARQQSQGDQEFILDQATDCIKVPRLRMLPDAKTPFLCEAGVAPREMQNIWKAAGEDALELTIDAAGSPDSIFFKRTDIRARHLDTSEVIIRTDAVGVNFRDLLLVLGSLPYTPLGFEGAGIVTTIGAGVKNVAVGDRVFYFAQGGGFATHVRIGSHQVCKIPEGLTSAEAASMPVAYTTAIVALNWTAHLQKGESVLIHAASGAVGQACIAIAKHIGAEIFVTAGTAEKREFLHHEFGIPKTNIFSSRTPDFRDGILSATKGLGVDVVVNSLSGPLLQETWSLIADFGRFIEIGKKDFLQNSYLGMSAFDRNVTFSGLDLLKYFARRPQDLGRCMSELVELFQCGAIKPVRPVTQIPISQTATALRKLQSGLNIGKLVVVLGPDEVVLAEKASPSGGISKQLFDFNATYLISGGTGGIGRALAPWMFANGAGNVVLLGRSGSSRPEVAKLLEQHNSEQKGTCLRAIACDVGSHSDLEAAMESIKDLPKVRGVIHGSLYIRDTLFATATAEDWQKITRPKIQAAWNLHHLCPELDFFVSLASFGGLVGNIGQSIYTGTSTFLDAFTEYRLSRGLPATSISLPLVLDVGYVAERGNGKDLEALMWLTMNESQIRTTIKAAIVGPASGMISNGKALVFVVNDTVDTARFTASPQLAILQRPKNKKIEDSDGINVSTNTGIGNLRGISRESALPQLLDTLMEKVALMTLMDKEEVEPDQPLTEYGLDSLVSVELRNWIRKETGVDLALSSIAGAENLQALAENIFSQM